MASVEALAALVAKKAGVVDLLHTKAERALVTAAQDETFRRYFDAKTDDERAALRDHIDHIALCGAKQVRRGGNVPHRRNRHGNLSRRPQEDRLRSVDAGGEREFLCTRLSPNHREKCSWRRFTFHPTCTVGSTAYATPVDVHGTKKAILHYEHGLDFYESVLNAGIDPTGARVLLTATSEGWVIFDTRRKIPIEQVGESEDPKDYFEQLSVGGLSLEQLKQAIGSSDEGSGTIKSADGKSLDVAFKTLGDWILGGLRTLGSGALRMHSRVSSDAHVK